MLDWLKPHQLIYCDTDSVIFIHDKTCLISRYPSNDSKTLPDNIRFGDALGQWEDEFKDGEYLKEILIGGAKPYVYITDKDKVVVKQKGITLDRANSNISTFERMKKVVLDSEEILSDKGYQRVWNSASKEIETR